VTGKEIANRLAVPGVDDSFSDSNQRRMNVTSGAGEIDSCHVDGAKICIR
jgi:hypothetical protein